MSNHNEEPIYQTEDECIQNFFMKNLEQLKYYKLSFCCISIFCTNNYKVKQANNCKKNIRKAYLPAVETYLTYDCIRKSKDLQEFIVKLKELKNICSENFLYKLIELIDSLSKYEKDE
ncbi:5554_t:CDS:1 [Scutellospora calospora]|uniref:5554_t:CDS:1 n=1 Tax=Scutellospora calospora TaxID=85575 RepID=A0ACA9N6B8_9GLOM|nr:5554_t:CDS:1 [Scutellospora calospora]